MTGIEDRLKGTGITSLTMDGAEPGGLLLSSKETRAADFWASVARPATSPAYEVLEISFGSSRMINVINFEASRFPCVITAEYSEDGEWKPFTHKEDARPDPVRHLEMNPVRLSISESVPAIVNTSLDREHPQHFGARHWKRNEWEVSSVKSDRIRFLLRRLNTEPPVSKTGTQVPYSLALRQVKVGYRISSGRDLPRGVAPEEVFESSRDSLGSSVFYSIYRQGPEKAIDGDSSTYWRSEPQPVNYAVVPLYLDLRDEEGNAQIIDKFKVDPETSGVAVNLYWSNEEPSGTFMGEALPVPANRRVEVGRTEVGETISFIETSGITVSDVFLRMKTDDAWWVGLDLRATAREAGVAYPILAFAGSTLTEQDGIFTFTGPNEETMSLAQHEAHVEGVDYRLVLSYHVETQDRGAYARLTYASEKYGHQESVEILCVMDDGQGISLGQTDPEGGPSALAVRSAVLKVEDLGESEQWFLDEGEEYVIDDQRYQRGDRRTNQNSILRMHPMFSTPDNIFAVVGGDGGRIENNLWHSINRDFVLRKGFLEFLPTKAKYWKFEFTNLHPRIFETFRTIDRTMLAFPSSVVLEASEIGPQATKGYLSPGVQTSVFGRNESLYSDALQSLRSSGGTPETTKVLVVKDLQAADQAADTGWVWQYQPWHLGSTAPRWSQPGRHYYEQVPVRHRSKVAFFVGIKELQPYRTDYSKGDDTAEYVDRFQGSEYISATENGFLSDEGFSSAGTSARLSSVTFLSYQSVRAVQFATVQTGPVQVLPDPDFLDSRGLYDYVGYGDVTPVKIADGTVRITRSAQEVDYSAWETITYGELEAYTYGELDGLIGATPGEIAADGGIQTFEPYSPMGRGEVTGRAVISSNQLVNGPVLLEIVDGSDVVASTEKTVPASGLIEMQVIYTPKSRFLFTEPSGLESTYGELEQFTYGQMEAYTYEVLESLPEAEGEEEGEGLDPFAGESLTLRLRQQGGYDDEFFVHRMALYDDPITWDFSNNDGESWHQAVGVRNDPHGILTFPQADHRLRWRFEIAMPDASVSSIHLRPWYGSRRVTAEPTHDLDRSGAVQSTWDSFPSLEQHPMWRGKPEGVEYPFIQPAPRPLFWRNLMVNPSGEGPYVDVEAVDGTASQED